MPIRGSRAATKITDRIKGIIENLVAVIGDCIEPPFVARNITISHGRFPGGVGSEYDVRQFLPFRVGERTHGDVWKALREIQGEDISIECLDRLGPFRESRSVVNTDPKRFQLNGSVDTPSVGKVSILVENSNHVAALRRKDGTGSNNLQGGKFMVVDACDIDSSVCNLNDSHIFTSQSTVRAAIDKAARIRRLGTSGDGIARTIGSI